MKVPYEAYHAFSVPMEGRVHGMYSDILGLITCAVGNLIDSRTAGLYPNGLVEAIRWTLADGTRAPLDVVRADWWKLKNNAAHYAKRHYKYALADTRCRLTDEEIDRIVKERLAINEAAMRKVLPDWDNFPADAQLAIMSMCWAVGTGWPQKFPRFFGLVKAQDWERAAALDDPTKPKGNWPGKIRETGNPGVVPRNIKNRFCLLNAAIVKAHNLPTETLWWPEVAPVDDFERAKDAVAAATAARDESVEAARQALALFPYEAPLGGAALKDYEAE